MQYMGAVSTTDTITRVSSDDVGAIIVTSSSIANVAEQISHGGWLFYTAIVSTSNKPIA